MTVTYTQDAAAADLALLSAMPEGDGWQDLTGQPLLAAAASRAGLPAEGQDTVTALPLGRSLYAYWANGELLTALLGETCLTDLQNASWAEWSALVQDLTAWLDAPAETALTLNGNAYTLPAQAPEAAAGLQGVFAVPGGEPAAAWSGAALTGALLAAGDERTDTALTGPLNGVYSALTLELENAASAEGTLADAASALAGGQALFVRAGLADLTAVLGTDAVQSLVPVPFKCYFEQSDLTTEEYDLTGLMNYPYAGLRRLPGHPGGQRQRGRRGVGHFVAVRQRHRQHRPDRRPAAGDPLEHRLQHHHAGGDAGTGGQHRYFAGIAADHRPGRRPGRSLHRPGRGRRPHQRHPHRLCPGGSGRAGRGVD